MTRKEQTQNHEERLRTYLRESGLRCTPERLHLLHAMTCLPTLFTMNDLMARMAGDEQFSVSRATCFNNVRLLQNANMLVRHRHSGQTFYQLCTKSLDVKCLSVCMRCGATKNVVAKNVVQAISHLNTRGFRITQSVIYFNGLCASCNRKEKQQKRNKDNERKS